VLVLDAHNTTSPGAAEIVVIVELFHEFVGKGLKILEVFLVDLSEGKGGGSLLVDELAEVSLSTDEAEGDTLGSAESWEEDDHLNGINIVGDDDKLCLAFLNEVGDVVETELDVDGLAGGSLAAGVGLSFKSFFLIGSSLWAVFGKHLKELGSY